MSVCVQGSRHLKMTHIVTIERKHEQMYRDKKGECQIFGSFFLFWKPAIRQVRVLYFLC